MADTATPIGISYANAVLHRVSAPFTAIYRGMIRMANNDPRYKELRALCALSDEELAKIGLRREILASHVMRGRAIY